jgi:nucleoside-diphosphate-sugar epimerase
MSPIDTLIVTGSNGFVGMSLLGYLNEISLEERPRRIVTFNRSIKAQNDSSYYSNLKIENRIADLTKPWKFDIPNAYLINLAADGSANSYSETASQLFLSVGQNAAEWIKKNRPCRVFHASSGAVQKSELSPSNIHDAKNMENWIKKQSFIKSRLAVENLLTTLSRQENIEIIVGHLYSFIGSNILAKTQYAVSSFIHGAVKNKRIFVEGSPKTTRSYLYQDDMSKWIIRSLQVEKPVNPIVIGSSKIVQMSELAEFIATVTDSEVEYLNPSAPSESYIADNAATLECLEVIESKKWQDAVLECIDFVKESRN